ncbi:TetR/AcrR family transcriptional regulator [Qipengyuania sp.]|uniref:TetR/AcrR family transcriptional regulator n=1 Tax=Qipengyuania sp. TaxID=2004515 RepID=UPI003BAAE4DC
MNNSASERLTQAALRLFQAKGLSSVGINEVVREAGVAKMSLYNNFSSKSDLAWAAYAAISRERRQSFDALIAASDSPKAGVLGFFDLAKTLANRPDFRGCAFINLAAHTFEDERLARLVRDHKSARHSRLEELARHCGADDPARLARQLLALWDGAVSQAAIENDTEPVDAAREAAEVLLERACQ